MTCIIAKKKVAFITVPKVACTSIKMACFELENGFPFRNYHANGVLRHIHDNSVYPAIAFSALNKAAMEGCLKLAMVRDPVRRLLSAYSNRVVFYRELSERHIGWTGLPVDPDIHTFIRLISSYRQASRSISLHTEPMTHFLGEDAGYYDRVFDISEMPEAEAMIRAHTGTAFEFPHEQTGGEKVDKSVLRQEEIEQIRTIYAGDYAAYGAIIKASAGVWPIGNPLLAG